MLVALAKVDSAKALEILYSQFKDVIAIIANKRVFRRGKLGTGDKPFVIKVPNFVNREDKEDLTGHLCLEFFGLIRKYDGRRKFRAYIADMLEWKAINWWKRHNRLYQRNVWYDECYKVIMGINDDFEDCDYEIWLAISAIFNEAGFRFTPPSDDLTAAKIKERIIELASSHGNEIMLYAALHYCCGYTQDEIASRYGFSCRTSITRKLAGLRKDIEHDGVLKELLGIEPN